MIGRALGSIVGVLMLLLGSLWILQGLDVVKAGFMAGHMQWAVYGGGLAVAGVVLIYWLNFRKTG